MAAINDQNVDVTDAAAQPDAPASETSSTPQDAVDVGSVTAEGESPNVRLYLSGLARATTKASIESFFKAHNASDVILKDRGDDSSYKFAFLTVPQSSAKEILDTSPHEIDGSPVRVEITRTPLRSRAKQQGAVAPVPISPKNVDAQLAAESKAAVRKLFLGGLSSTTTSEDLITYFSAYGEVVDSCVMADSASGRPRGFGFVSFATAEAVTVVTKAGRYHRIGDRDVDVKPAIPRESMSRADGHKQSGRRAPASAEAAKSVPTGELGWYSPSEEPTLKYMYAASKGQGWQAGPAPSPWGVTFVPAIAPQTAGMPYPAVVPQSLVAAAPSIAPAIVPAATGIPVYGGYMPTAAPSAMPSPMPYTFAPGGGFALAPGFAPHWAAPQGC